MLVIHSEFCYGMCVQKWKKKNRNKDCVNYFAQPTGKVYNNNEKEMTYSYTLKQK